MNLKKLTLVFLITATAGVSSAQVRNVEVNETNLEEKMRGTFQIIVSGDQKIALSTQLLTEIEKNRSATQEINYKINDQVTVKILPKNLITSSGFNKEDYPVYVYRNPEKGQPVLNKKYTNGRNK